ncbi:hypothetical protein BP6252_04343 [Coleophoma cylindrospora]|uniref:Meiotically up-regulated gene 154 protein n=1 Tax=Coleophoma cylindrospora TaxID=1849047 RepID=A0A3D8S086_9HELO|nr:hypothetical protein BP6252_04343 [Coleophoma cylindrospora]
MPRLVRRRPLLERVKAYLNPLDFLLWLSEELETRDWDNKTAVTPFAFGFHFVFLIARANSRISTGDDVFGDERSGSSWLTSLAHFLVLLLSCLSVGNAAYTFLRKRHYRLFESNVETPQTTPSARRVRVDSSPMSSSPLRYVKSILPDTNVNSRVHPDPTRDVWELAVWDPIPVCLRLFCLFSPGHVLVYWLFLPTHSSDPHPSIAVFRTLFLQALLSAQLLLLQSSFSQQIKDTAIIHKEVLSEYDIKFVHPRLNPLMRDVGTQHSDSISGESGDIGDSVDTYTPTVILRRDFRTNPNPNYAKHIDPDDTAAITQTRDSSSPVPKTPMNHSVQLIPNKTPSTAIRQPQFRKSASGVILTGAGTSTGDGGSLGIYSHANSPLKKASSMYDINRQSRPPRNSFAMAAREIREERERSRSRSPEKRDSSLHRPMYKQDTYPVDNIDRRPGMSTGIGKPRSQGIDRTPSRW